MKLESIQTNKSAVAHSPNWIPHYGPNCQYENEYCPRCNCFTLNSAANSGHCPFEGDLRSYGTEEKGPLTYFSYEMHPFPHVL